MKKIKTFFSVLALSLLLAPLLVQADSPADLVVTDIDLGLGNRVVYTLENQGGTNEDTVLNGVQTIALDGVIQQSLPWFVLSEVDFLAAGDSSTYHSSVRLTPGIHMVEVCVDTTDIIAESDENNCLSKEFDVGTHLGPDLVVSAISFNSSNAVEYEISNEGDRDIDPSLNGSQTISVDGDSSGIYRWALLDDLNFLTAGGSSDFITGTTLEEGTHTVEICVDTTDLVVESDENNCFSEELTVPTSGDDDDDSTGDDDDDSSGGGSNSHSSHNNPDLSVNNIYIQSDGDIVANLSNEGDEDVDASDEVRVQLTIDGDLEWTQDYEQSSSDTFLDEDEESDINMGDLLRNEYETYEITVCVDSLDRVDELRESNNCRTENLSIDDDAGDEGDDDDSNGPDLSVDNIYIQSDGDIVANLSNEGDEDVSYSDEVRVELRIDGDLEWSKNYEQSSSDDFLDENEESDVNMGDLLRDEDETYEIEVCVDTEDEVNEDHESNNCRTENLSIEDDAGDEDVSLSSEDSSNDCDAYFYDTDNDPAEDEICNLYDREVVVGRRPHYYVPRDSVTRAEFLKIALLNSGLDVEGIRSGDDFTDVSTGDWFYDYVTFARDLGIVGADDGKFYPNEPITRAEAMAVLVRLELDGSDLDDLLDEDLDDSDIDFSDVDNHDWFAPYIVYGEENDLIHGYDNGTFRPGNLITRSEAAEIAYNLYRNRY